MKYPVLFQLSLCTLLTAVSISVYAIAKSEVKTTLSSNAKTNVCSITINSSDEIEVFKSMIGEKNANFIELTTLPDAETKDGQEAEYKPEESFLKKACRQKIKCDVLVISGHFGGTFFGSSGLNLSMEELEQHSCDDSCDGILQNPKEVFLFGCNTLAGKKQDHRTPEQYRAVLRADGFSPEQAEQVVAFRYSPLGDAFGDRMRRVFRGTPRIYGFDSVGPSGKNVRGLLKNYFKSINTKSYYIPENLRKLDVSTNGALAKALKETALAQAAGAKELTRQQIPVCFLNNPEVGFYHKLNWIVSSLYSEKSFSYLPSINDWLSRLTVENYPWRDKEFEVLEKVTYNTKLRDSLAGIVKRRDSSILGMQLKVLTFMKFFGWIYSKDYLKKVEDLLLGDLKQDYDVETKDQICSYAEANQMRVDFSPEQIPAARWNDPEFIAVLECAAGFNEALMEKSLRMYLNTHDEALQRTYRQFIYSMNIPEIAWPRFFRTLAPQPNKFLSPLANDLMCSGRFDKTTPMMDLSQLHPELAKDPKYLASVGCYVKFNREIFKSLIDSAKTVERGDSVFLSLHLYSTRVKSILLDAESQDELMDLTQSPLSSDAQANLVDFWSGVKNITPAATLRFKSILTALDTKPRVGGDGSQNLENIASVALGSDVYCPFALDRAATALKAGHWQTTVSILERVFFACPRKLDDSFYGFPPLELAQLKSIMTGVLRTMGPKGSNQWEDELYEFSDQWLQELLENKIAIENLEQANFMLRFNDRTDRGRRGKLSSDSSILEQYDKKILADDVRRALKGSDKNNISIAYRILKSVDIDDDQLVSEMLQKIRRDGLSFDIETIIAAAGRQDGEKTAALWLELYLKNHVKDDPSLPRFPLAFDLQSSPLIRQLKVGLKNKSIKPQAGGQLLKRIAWAAPVESNFQPLRDFIRQFEKEFPSPEIKKAAREAQQATQDREAECEEFPRACEIRGSE